MSDDFGLSFAACAARRTAAQVAQKLRPAKTGSTVS